METNFHQSFGKTLSGKTVVPSRQYIFFSHSKFNINFFFLTKNHIRLIHFTSSSVYYSQNQLNVNIIANYKIAI